MVKIGAAVAATATVARAVADNNRNKMRQLQQQRQQSWQRKFWQRGSKGSGGFGRQQVTTLSAALEVAFAWQGEARTK
jgi:hypothetical protein